MTSGNLTSSVSTHDIDGRWQGSGRSILVEVKKTNSVRDVRDAFLALAYRVRDEPPSSTAVCVFIDTRLSHGRLQEELDRFRGVIHPAIAERVHFLVDNANSKRDIVASNGSMKDAPSEFYAWLGDLVAGERLQGQRQQLPARQVVVAALAQLRLRNRPPVTVKHLQETCQVSYPTVALVLRDLTDKGWLEDSGDRGVRLRYLTAGEWIELAREHARQRKVQVFTDPTGLSSPEQMVKRLARVQAADKISRQVRVGGVIGATGYFPALDITAAPRLDLCADADPAQLASILDAGLVPKTKPEQHVALAIHVTRNTAGLMDPGVESLGQGQVQLASELDCLSDLVEMGFTREAAEMAHHVELTNKEGVPTL